MMTNRSFAMILVAILGGLSFTASAVEESEHTRVCFTQEVPVTRAFSSLEAWEMCTPTWVGDVLSCIFPDGVRIEELQWEGWQDVTDSLGSRENLQGVYRFSSEYEMTERCLEVQGVHDANYGGGHGVRYWGKDGVREATESLSVDPEGDREMIGQFFSDHFGLSETEVRDLPAQVWANDYHVGMAHMWGWWGTTVVIPTDANGDIDVEHMLYTYTKEEDWYPSVYPRNYLMRDDVPYVVIDLGDRMPQVPPVPVAPKPEVVLVAGIPDLDRSGSISQCDLVALEVVYRGACYPQTTLNLLRQYAQKHPSFEPTRRNILRQEVIRVREMIRRACGNRSHATAAAACGMWRKKEIRSISLNK